MNKLPFGPTSAKSERGLTAEIAIEMYKRGTPIREKEFESMRVDENLKYLEFLEKEGILPRQPIEAIREFLEMGVIKSSDTVKKAQRKINEYLLGPFPAG